MKGKNLLQRLDFVILAVVVIFAAAMSGTSLRFTLSSIDTANQTNTQIPYVTKDGKQTLQLNTVKFNTNQPTPGKTVFACPGKKAPEEPPDNNLPQPTSCPKQMCATCNNSTGACTIREHSICFGTCEADCAKMNCQIQTPKPVKPVTPKPIVE